MKGILKAACLLVLVCGMQTGCTKDGGDARTIVFTASSPSVSTKTAYSGEEFDHRERIDWTVGDKFTIYCNAGYAHLINDRSQRWCDYYVMSAAADRAVSRAEVQAVGGNGLVWNAPLVTPPYRFYARYPADHDAFEVDPDTHDVNFIKFTQPAEQILKDVSGRDVDFQPVMSKYGFMYAYAELRSTDDTRVGLQFKSKFTALQFVIGSGGNEVVKLSQFDLESGSTPLSGEFTVKCDSDGTVDFGTDPPYYGTYRGLGVDFRNSFQDEVLKIGERPVAITLFALPTDLTDITLTITGDRIGTRNLKLNDSDGNPIRFLACKKYVIKGLDLPELLKASSEDINWDVRGVGESIYWD